MSTTKSAPVVASSNDEDEDEEDLEDDEDYDDADQLKADLEKAREEYKKLQAAKQKNEF